MQTSGLVLDVYDDFNGETLRSLYPTLDTLPEGVKTASNFNGTRDQLPDDVFALVMVNNGEKLRKYACVDPGNTELSVAYFLKNAHKLPVEAQKTAAENLITASGWYDLAVPEELVKKAGLLGSAMGALSTGSTLLGAGKAVKNNMAAAGQAGGQLLNPALIKAGEVNGTMTAPMEEPGKLSPTPSKTTINKTARVGHLVSASKSDHEEMLQENSAIAGEGLKSLPQTKHLRPTVDVTNAKPPTYVTEKKASLYALPSASRYPIDSYAQVKAAGAYFGEHYKLFAPEERREYAVNLVKQASAMAIDVPDIARKYGAEGLAPEFEIKIAFDARRLELQAYPDVLRVLDAVEDVILTQGGAKLASLALHPIEACALLSEFDKDTGLNRSYDRTIPDPYFSIFGEKTASKAAWSDIVGNDMITYADLRRLAHVGTHTVRDTFGEDFQEEFRKDPIGVYESLPRDQKKMVIHMAQGTAPGAEPAY
jgi:hypothetical protein